MFSLRVVLFVSCLALASLSQAQTDQTEQPSEHEEHGAHEHGTAHLSIAIADQALEIHLDSPAANIFGFEHEAHSEADKKTLAEASAQLAAGADLFAFEPAAACKFKTAEIKTEGAEPADHDEHEAATQQTETTKPTTHQHQTETNEAHQDLQVTWLFTCEQTDALKTITPTLFSRFSGFKNLKVEWVSAKGASATQLVKDEPIQFAP